MKVNDLFSFFRFFFQSFLDSQQVLKIAEMLQHNSSDSRERVIFFG